MHIHTKRAWRSAALFAALGLFHAAHADDLAGYKTVHLVNGLNNVRLQGHDVTAVKAWRENYNAHGFTFVTLYMHDKNADGQSPWAILPVFGKQKGEEHEEPGVSISGGADCMLHDFRLLSASDGRPAVLIIAQRDFGESYADDALVHFEYYELTHNADFDVGYPEYYFSLKHTTTSRAKYCDVNDAFEKELHIKQ